MATAERAAAMDDVVDGVLHVFLALDDDEAPAAALAADDDDDDAPCDDSPLEYLRRCSLDSGDSFGDDGDSPRHAREPGAGAAGARGGGRGGRDRLGTASTCELPEGGGPRPAAWPR